MELYENDRRAFLEALTTVDKRTKTDFYRSMLETMRLGLRIQAESGVNFKNVMLAYINKF